jgi:hypothetical protein
MTEVIIRGCTIFAQPGFSPLLLGFFLLHLWMVPQAISQVAASGGTSLTTQERVKMRGIWPTKGADADQAFAGDTECAKCHTDISRTQMTTPMANAASLANQSEILQENPALQFHVGANDYRIARKASNVRLSVSCGNTSIATKLDWAFGLGKKGQTYLYSRDGSWYESRVSFYNTLQGLDVTTGNLTAKSYALENSLGRLLDPEDARRCFACHTSQSTTSERFHPETAIPGVRCESCHGSGAQHVSDMKKGRIDAGRRAILNPKKLSPVDSMDFCGACHRTWGDVVDEGITGVITVRFQPYRLENSRCWGKGDERLTCIVCHNPHEQLVHETASYDQKCLNCHLAQNGSKPTKDHPGTACPVSTNNCVSCHMPKVEVPSMHAAFTDHLIQIVRSAP